MCHVACGKLDCYYEVGYGGPWDVAAGQVIVQEVRFGGAESVRAREGVVNASTSEVFRRSSSVNLSC